MHFTFILAFSLFGSFPSLGVAPEQLTLNKLETDDVPGFLSFVNEGKELLVVGDNNAWARKWDLSTAKIKTSFKTLWPVQSCAISATKRTLASYSPGCITLYDIQSGKRVGTILHGGVISFSPDTRTLAIADCENHKILLWDLDCRQ